MQPLVLKLDMMQTLALAAVVLFAGYGIRRRVGVLDRYNIPAPVVGGFLFASLALIARLQGWLAFEFDTTLQVPLMIAFFTTIGLGASLALLKVGGWQVAWFWFIATVVALLQSGLGVGLATMLDVHPFLGLIAGPITLTGGHGTGAAFGKLMEDQYQFSGAVTLAMAAATFGLVSGGLMGGPIATRLISKFRLRSAEPAAAPVTDPDVYAVGLDSEIDTEMAGDAPTAFRLLKGLTVVLVAMWAGSLLRSWLGHYVTLPVYIWSMIIAAALRNADDFVGTIKIDQRVIDDLGSVALSLFLSMALMSLRLWELLNLAVPMLIILLAQVVLMAVFAYFLCFRLMGRDYEAAVMSSGLCGFGMGSTANAVANMDALVARFGAAPRAFLVVPMVGAFFIDFTNALIITAFMNWFH